MEVRCLQCNKEFNKKPFRIKRDTNHFCSADCVYEWKKNNPMSDETRAKIGEKNKVKQQESPQPTGKDNPRFTGFEAICEYCNKIVLVTDKRRNGIHFCNRDCYDNYRTENKYTITNCEYCGKEITKRTLHTKLHKSYCSDECRRSHFGEIYRGENAPGWKGGVSFEKYPQDFKKVLKQFIRDRDDNLCQICGCTKEEMYSGNRDTNLHVHHIDYDKYNCNEENLITLCNSCHAKTNHNRQYWEEYFINLIEKII